MLDETRQYTKDSNGSLRPWDIPRYHGITFYTGSIPKTPLQNATVWSPHRPQVLIGLREEPLELAPLPFLVVGILL